MNYQGTTMEKIVKEGRSALVKAMLTGGSDPNRISSASGRSLLMTAALFEQIETVKVLIQAHADVNFRNESGVTALMVAVETGTLDIVKLPVEAGAELNPRNQSGSTALDIAMYKNYLRILHYLRDAEAIAKGRPTEHEHRTDNVSPKPNPEPMTRFGTTVGTAAKGFLHGLGTFVEAAASAPSPNAPKQNLAATTTPPAVVKFEAEDTLQPLLDELDRMVGLQNVKYEVKKHLSVLRIQSLRMERGLSSIPKQTLHMVFTGNPGTGKTSIARLLAKIYKEMGILSKGRFKETDRSGLVSGYVGQTALQVAEVVKEALGGVLFIDEAYSLITDSGSSHDFGREAIDTLLKLMEDHRDDLIVIVAGYTEPMSAFLRSNPGLQSRFNKYLHFEDYNPSELFNIFIGIADKHQYDLTEQTEEKLLSVFESWCANKRIGFGNAREVRNLFESSLSNHALRVSASPSISDADLVTLQPVDISL